MKSPVVVLAVALCAMAATAALAADVTCMYGIDNSDEIFARFNPYNGSITTLSSIPDNSSARVSTTFNAVDKQYIMVSQLAAANDGLSLLTVDVMTGKVLSNLPFGTQTNFPCNLAYSPSAREVPSSCPVARRGLFQRDSRARTCVWAFPFRAR